MKPDDPNRRPKPKWKTVRIDDMVHVVPLNATHFGNAECWCHPTVTKADGEIPICTHRTELQCVMEDHIPDYCPGLLT